MSGLLAKTVRAGLSILRIQTASGLQYRLAALASVVTPVFWAVVEVIVIRVYYSFADNYGAGVQAGLTLQQAVSYLWLAQVIHFIQPMRLEGEIVAKITSGDVGLELCRPLDIQLHWFMRSAGSRLSAAFVHSGPVAIAAILMPAGYALGPPASPASFGAMLCTIIGAVCLSSALTTLMYVMQLNVAWGSGPSNMFSILAGVLSGGYVPLQFWPDFMQGFLRWQPFAGLVDLPLRLYVGALEPDEVWGVLLSQFVWTTGFLVLGRLMLRRNLKRLVVQGG